MAWVEKQPDIFTGALYDDKNPMYAIRRARMLDANNEAEAKSMRDLETAQAKARANAQAKADAMAEAAKNAVEKDKAKELLKGIADAKAQAKAEAEAEAREAAEEAAMKARKAAREAMEAAWEQEKKDAALRSVDIEKKQLNLLIENSVKIPEEFLESNIKSGSIQDAEKYLTNMIGDLHQVKKLEDVHVHVDDAKSHGLTEHDGIYLMVIPPKILNLDQTFLRDYEANIHPLKIVFIRVIQFSSDAKSKMMFNAYRPNGEPITCRRQISVDGKHNTGYEKFGPTMCLFELPLEKDLTNSQVKLYYPKPSSTIFPDVRPLKNPAHMFPRTAGKKLRSAKKTSKRRSVKSKPRYYRRSVGSINHRRKKTTRRRR